MIGEHFERAGLEMDNDPKAAMAPSGPPRSPEFIEWDLKGRALAAELLHERTKWAVIYRKMNLHRKIWQTFVVISTAISTGLAGFLVNNKDSQWSILLAVIVAIAGAVSAVRDAWQINEAGDDAKDRYLELNTLTNELERTRFEIAGQTRDSDVLPKIRGTVEHVKARLEELRDDLSDRSAKPIASLK